MGKAARSRPEATERNRESSADRTIQSNSSRSRSKKNPDAKPKDHRAPSTCTPLPPGTLGTTSYVFSKPSPLLVQSHRCHRGQPPSAPGPAPALGRFEPHCCLPSPMLSMRSSSSSKTTDARSSPAKAGPLTESFYISHPSSQFCSAEKSFFFVRPFLPFTSTYNRHCIAQARDRR